MGYIDEAIENSKASGMYEGEVSCTPPTDGSLKIKKHWLKSVRGRIDYLEGRVHNCSARAKQYHLHELHALQWCSELAVRDIEQVEAND